MQLISALERAPSVTARIEPPDQLTFVEADIPGISRKRVDDDFVFLCAKTGREITKDERARIDGLGIPPAWTDVWICPLPNGHLQATGVDDAGRKQYRYHPAWRAYRERTKFHGLTAFGANLPRIRRRVRRTFRECDEPELELVIAALVRLLDDAPLRIGNQSYANSALGASTLKKRNVRFAKGALHLDYTAKGGKRVRRQIKDKRLMQTLNVIDELPGKTLFRYVGSDGDTYPLRSEQVNDWLKAVTSDAQITAKTFRTWAGSLAAFERAVSDEELTIKAMSEAAAKELRNTPSIARSSYIHPGIIDLKDRSFDERKELASRVTKSARDLTRLETAMLGYLAEADGYKVS